MREIAVLREVDHPHVVRLWDVAFRARPAPRLFLVFECLATDLRQCLEAGPPLAAARVAAFGAQLFGALDYLHTRGFVHRDVKPANVLLDGALAVAKLADFGLARTLGLVPARPRTPNLVTLWYRAPEILYGDPHYATPVDVWALGCVLAEALACRPLFPCDSEPDLHARLVDLLGAPAVATWPALATLPRRPPAGSGAAPADSAPARLRAFLPSHVPPALAGLLAATLAYNPAARPTAAQAGSHPALREAAAAS